MISYLNCQPKGHAAPPQHHRSAERIYTVDDPHSCHRNTACGHRGRQHRRPPAPPAPRRGTRHTCPHTTLRCLTVVANTHWLYLFLLQYEKSFSTISTYYMHVSYCPPSDQLRICCNVRQACTRSVSPLDLCLSLL